MPTRSPDLSPSAARGRSLARTPSAGRAARTLRVSSSGPGGPVTRVRGGSCGGDDCPQLDAGNARVPVRRYQPPVRTFLLQSETSRFAGEFGGALPDATPWLRQHRGAAHHRRQPGIARGRGQPRKRTANEWDRWLVHCSPHALARRARVRPSSLDGAGAIRVGRVAKWPLPRRRDHVCPARYAATYP